MRYYEVAAIMALVILIASMTYTQETTVRVVNRAGPRSYLMVRSGFPLPFADIEIKTLEGYSSYVEISPFNAFWDYVIWLVPSLMASWGALHLWKMNKLKRGRSRKLKV